MWMGLTDVYLQFFSCGDWLLVKCYSISQLPLADGFRWTCTSKVLFGEKKIMLPLPMIKPYARLTTNGSLHTCSASTIIHIGMKTQFGPYSATVFRGQVEILPHLSMCEISTHILYLSNGQPCEQWSIEHCICWLLCNQIWCYSCVTKSDKILTR